MSNGAKDPTADSRASHLARPSDPITVKEAAQDLAVAAKHELVTVTRAPRTRRLAGKAWPFVRLGLYGAAFGAGALLVARYFGPPAVRDLGEQGGRAFAQGVADAQRAIADQTRGLRFL